ncbi:MAG: glycine cleavage system protein R [Actinomycetota bacterium]
MHEVTVTAVGRDRPGIVAGVTGVFLELGCNLADCTMTRLGGQFAMILLVEVPDEVGVERLREALKDPAGQFGLDVSTRDAKGPSVPEDHLSYVISVYGADRPGIVHEIAKELASAGVNIADLVSHVVGDNIYTMILEVELPPDADAAGLERRLQAAAEGIGLDVTLRPMEASEL